MIYFRESVTSVPCGALKVVYHSMKTGDACRIAWHREVSIFKENSVPRKTTSSIKAKGVPYPTAYPVRMLYWRGPFLDGV